ncbi:integrase, catalytic region, zinc finger, CCHC-type containing protein, partial [Tanacetum coccineum]
EGQIVVQNVQGQQNQNQRYFSRENGAAGFGVHIARNCTQPKRPHNSNYFKDKMLLLQAQENGAVLDEEELLFLVGEQPNTFDADVDNQPVRDLARNENNIFQADECDAFDSNVDDEPTSQSIFMANLSSAGPTNLQASSSDASILSESTVIDSNNADMGNSNVIPYEQYLNTNDVSVVPSCASSALNNAYVVIDNNVHTSNEPLVTELAIYKEQVAIYKQRAKFELTEREQRMDDQMHILIQDRAQNPFYLRKAKVAQPTLYDGNEIINSDHDPTNVPSSEEDLVLAELARQKMHEKMNDPVCVEKRIKCIPPNYSKENFLATFTPQTQLTPEQVFWSIDLEKRKAEELKANTPPLPVLPPATVYPPNTPVHLVPRTLPTTSQVNIGLYVITQLFWDFEKTCKKRITPTGITEGERGFEQTKRCYLTEVIPFFNLLKEHFDSVQKSLVTEVRAMKAVFENMEAEVDQNAVDKKCGEIERKNLLITNENLIAECLSKDVFYTATDSVLNVSRFSDMHDAFTIAQKRIADLESENFNLRNKIQNDDHDSMIKHFSKLEVEHFNLQLKYQNLKERFGNKKPVTSSDAPSFDSLFVIGKLNEQIQSRGNTIRELKEKISRLTKKNSDADPIFDLKALVSQNKDLTAKLNALHDLNERFRAENAKVKQHYKELYDSIKITRAKTTDQNNSLLSEIENLKAQLKDNSKCVTIPDSKPKVLAPGRYPIDVEPIPPRHKNNREVHLHYIKHLKENVETLREIVEDAKVERPLDTSLASACRYTKHSQELLEYVLPTKQWKPTGRLLPLGRQCPLLRSTALKSDCMPADPHETSAPVVQIVLWYLDSCCLKHMTGDRSRLRNFVKKFIGTIRFGNNHFCAIMGYRDYVIVLEVAFRKHTCFVRDLNGVDLIKGSRGMNLYTNSVEDMMRSSPICLLSRASKNKSWLWHHRQNHLNFGTLNDLAHKDLVRGLHRLKFEKDHLCSACQLGKRRKATLKPKTINTIMEVLHTLHMDLCGPLRV